MRLLAAALAPLPAVLLAGATGAAAAVDQTASPRPQLSQFRFTPQPLKPRQSGAFRFVTTREGGATIALTRQVGGRLAAGGACVSPARSPRGAVCLRAIPAGRLRFAVDAGEGLKRFDGRINGKRLPAGRYLATLLVLNDAFGDSDPAYATVRIAAR